jgi:Cu/Ag efflux protein CusF
MKKMAVPALAALMVMSGSFAWAWSDVTGTIDKINMKSHEIVLDNGETYMVQKNVKLDSFKKGEKVTLSVENEKGKNMANKVTMAKG